MFVIPKNKDTRNHTVKAFLTPEEYDVLTISARRLHMSNSEYIRMKVFGPKWNRKAEHR